MPLDDGALDEARLTELIERFHRVHFDRFSFDDRQESVEMVTLRLTGIGALGGIGHHQLPAAPSPAKREIRPVYLGGCWLDVPVIQQDTLDPARPVVGPAIIEQDYTTLLLTGGWHLSLVPGGDMVAGKQAAGEGEQRP